MRIAIPQPAIHYELNSEQLRDAAQKYLRQMIGVYYEDIQVDHHGRRRFTSWTDTGHGSGLTEWHREVTEADQKIIDVITMVDATNPNWL